MVPFFRHAGRILCTAIGDFDRPQAAPITRVVHAIVGELIGRAARQVAQPAPNLVSLYGRADAAYQAEFAKWEALIANVRADRGLSDDQRASAIVALRIRQRVEAQAVRHRLIQEERQAAKLRSAHARVVSR